MLGVFNIYYLLQLIIFLAQGYDDVLKSMDQSLKQVMGHIQEYDPTMETRTPSNANDFDASPALPLPSPPSIPLLPSLLSTENTEELAVNTTMGNSSLVSNSSDHQLTGVSALVSSCWT